MRHCRSVAYSISCRNAAAAANGPTTRLASVSAHKNVNGVPNGTGPPDGRVCGGHAEDQDRHRQRQDQNGSSSPPRRSATAMAAPISPMKVSAGVPTSSVSTSARCRPAHRD